jgi:hypothetical protein
MKSVKSFFPIFLLLVFFSSSLVAAVPAAVSVATTTVAQPKNDVYKWKIKRNTSKTGMQKIAAELKEMGCALIVSKLEYEGKKIKHIELEIRTSDNKKVNFKETDMKKPVCIELIQNEGKTVSVKAGPC